MNICDQKNETKITGFKAGNLYQWRHSDGTLDQAIYMASNKKNNLLNLSTGNLFESDSFSSYIDVTDQYCLQKVT